MAAINLIPNIEVIVGQGVVFGATIYVVNKLIVKPYSELRAKRDSLTTGSQDDAKAMFKEVESKALEIKEKRAQALKSASDVRAQAKEKATASANEIIAEAKQKAGKEVEASKSAIRSNLKEELSKVNQIANNISSEIFRAAVN